MKYRSKLERMVAKKLPQAEYEPWKMSYSIPKTYTPDFVQGKICYEVKGYFRAGDTQKYKAVHKQMLEDGYDFRFILQDPNKKVSKGAKLTMAGWCDKQGIIWQKA